MGGGQHDPRDARQTGTNEYHNQVPRAISPSFTRLLNGDQENWLQPLSPNEETHLYNRAEPAHHHNIFDELEELDNTDIDLDANGSSPEAIVEPIPSLKRERSRLASGPSSRRALLDSSSPSEIKKIKACIRCRMQKMKVSCDFDSYTPVN
jgi:hypothetical protein